MADEFDYVIVGAGSAGCVLAEGLSRDGRHTVAVLEAGPRDTNFFIHMPLGYGKTFFDRRINWMYEAEPDPGLGGRRDFWPRGRVLGGSSAINAMVWMRGDRLDFEEWRALGNPGWGWADVLPYFRKIEHNQAGANELRAQGGPVHISDVSDRLHPLTRLYLKAAAEAGIPFNPDFNGPTQEGAGIYQINTKGGRRMSAARAFLKPAMARRNVSVLTEAQATRVLFEGRRAVGVEFRRGGETRTLRARREIILSGGAVNSPQLLELSGIGGGALLQRHGIPVLVENPAVGEHMQDHLGINYVYRARTHSLNQVLRPWWGQLAAGVQFLALGRGPLSLSLNQGGAFVKTRRGLDRANIQIYLQAISTFTGKTGTRPLLKPDPFPGFALGLSNCRPTSVGSIHIGTPDPMKPPRIVPNGLSTAHDIQDALEGVRLLRHIAAQPSLASVIEAELAPGPKAVTDDDLIEDFRRRCGTVYHPMGTCRMGPAPGGAVVDSRLRVHGAEALRVVDASAFPAMITGNTNAPSMMVGAKAVDLILADAR